MLSKEQSKNNYPQQIVFIDLYVGTLANHLAPQIKKEFTMAKAKTILKSAAKQLEEVDYSLNDLLLRGRISAKATSKELPGGDKVVEFRLIVTRGAREGVDTLDIGAWSSKSRRIALTLDPQEWVEISGSIHRRFWQSPTGVASRWQIEATEIVRL